jgi:hypothetical protein
MIRYTRQRETMYIGNTRVPVVNQCSLDVVPNNKQYAVVATVVLGLIARGLPLIILSAYTRTQYYLFDGIVPGFSRILLFEGHAQFPPRGLRGRLVLQGEGRPVDIYLVPGFSVAQDLVFAGDADQRYFEGAVSKFDLDVLRFGLLWNDEFQFDFVVGLCPRVGFFIVIVAIVVLLNRFSVCDCGTTFVAAAAAATALLFLEILERLAQACRSTAASATAAFFSRNLAPLQLLEVPVDLLGGHVDPFPYVPGFVVDGPPDKHVAIHSVGLSVAAPSLVVVMGRKRVPAGQHQVRRSLVEGTVLRASVIVAVHRYRGVSVEFGWYRQTRDFAARRLLLLDLQETDDFVVVHSLDLLGRRVLSGVLFSDRVGDLLFLGLGRFFQYLGPLIAPTLFQEILLGIFAQGVVRQPAFP